MDIKEILEKCDHTLLRVDCTSQEIRALCDQAIKYHCASVCIPPCHAGRGLGRQMVQYAKQHAAAMGCTVIRLDTWAGNTPAARLYQTNGFSLCGRAEVLFQGRIPEELIFLEYQI